MYVISKISRVVFKKTDIIATLLLICTFASTPVLGQVSLSSVVMNGATISLVSAPAMSSALLGDAIVLEQDERLAFIEIDLDENWKTYWRLPGRFGIAPVLDWSASENVRSVEALLPMPSLFDEGDGISIGYKDDVLWPVRIQPGDPKEPVIIRLRLDIGLCEVLCLPASAELTWRMSPGSGDAASLADILDLATQLPSERAALSALTFDHVGEDLRLTLAENIEFDSFAVAENVEGRHSLLRVDAAGVLQGRWPHETPPNQISLMRPGIGMEIFRLEE